MAKKKDDGSRAPKEKRKQGGEKRGKTKRAPYSSIDTHPRARASVRRTKAWVGLAGFVIAALLSAQASVPVAQVGERALIAGIVGYLLAWWISMLVWRQLMLAEQRAAIEEIERRRSEEAEEEPAPAERK